MELWKFTLENLEAAGSIGGYVAISLFGVAFISLALQDRIRSSARIGPQWAHPIVGALLGAIPGCGGTIVVSTMYKNNQISFGALLAAFTATLGEGSFVLLGASDEADVVGNLTAFAIVNAVGFVLGIILGYGVDLSGFRVAANAKPKNVSGEEKDKYDHVLIWKFVERTGFYLIIAFAIFLVPGSIMALWGGGIDVIEEVTTWVASVLAMTCIAYYMLNRFALNKACHATPQDGMRSVLSESVSDLAMVVMYVFVGLFITNGIIDELVGAERFDAWMSSSESSLVLIAALIGVTPGCGGMIAVAVAYVTIPNFPIAGLIAASIATSGDGIFPLLAQNRKDAVIISEIGFGVAVAVGYLALL